MTRTMQEAARFVRWSRTQGIDTSACDGEELRRHYRIYRAEQGHWSRPPQSQDSVSDGPEPEIRMIDGVRWRRLEPEQ